MTHVFIVLDANTCIQRDYPKTADELFREIELGTFECPAGLKNPTAVRLQNYLLVAERETSPMLSVNQQRILFLLSMGASEAEISQAMQLSFSGVRHHVTALKKKYNVSTREELISIYSKTHR
ncbi:MAG: hypothetical protein IJI57_14415 [Flexilinea sp.]|nr:hypothetical protein [Flexilinea sp.]